VKVAVWARSFGVHPQTAYRWFREDRMPVPAVCPWGTIVVEVPHQVAPPTCSARVAGRWEASAPETPFSSKSIVGDQLVVEDPIKDGGRD
jgi:hypothetical protein